MRIERIDTISPLLGAAFAKNAIMVALISLLAVIIVLGVVYRRIVIAVPVIITALSEILITLGIARLIGWNIDLAAVAGIIAVIGTGVDDQIVIIDEVLRGKNSYATSWKQRLKNAFFIIFVAYFATLVAMVPLWYAGAGMLKGFAVTTILGVSAGVLITRPAFGAFMEAFTKDEDSE
jgi:preprotein translocase subunit SecD